MLKQKYIHSILKQNKLNTINIKFKFRIIEPLLMDENMDSINMEKKWLFFATVRNLVPSHQKYRSPSSNRYQFFAS